LSGYSIGVDAMMNLLVPILVALTPGCLTLLKFLRRVRSLWIVSLLGGGGWLLALLLRIPILMLNNTFVKDIVLSAFIASLMAGIFEELTRYFVIKLPFIKMFKNDGAVAVGLGWGLAEAVLIYVVNVAVLAPVFNYTWVDLLPGAFERNTAILMHVTLSLIVFHAINAGFKWLLTAVLTHTAFNVVGVLTLFYIVNVWITELVLFCVGVAVFLYVFKFLKK